MMSCENVVVCYIYLSLFVALFVAVCLAVDLKYQQYFSPELLTPPLSHYNFYKKVIFKNMMAGDIS